MWLRTESTIIYGLARRATFLTAIPYDENTRPKSWGFWQTPLFIQWIGPRHTNFPDGSVCAYEPRDGTWTSEKGIVALLDFYSIWALQHLYLENLERWPGHQSVWHPHERLTEMREDEYCGCENSDRLYGECCRPKDLTLNRIDMAFDFWKIFGKHRSPPEVISKFMNGSAELPHLKDYV